MSPALLLLAAVPAAMPTAASDLKLPPGFTARLYADHPLAPDIYTMTIDAAGRVLVAGRGYVRVLVEDGQGHAVRAVDLVDGLKDGPMGLLAEADSLYVVADGGLKRYPGYNGRDKLKAPETLFTVKTSGEHDAHAVRRGPDGWLYLLCGNSAGVRKEIISGERSPVKEPIAGALLRMSPDGKSVEVVADGFRNPYSFDFNLDGEPFTYDSDNERCVGLPWFEGCRFYHIVPGGNHGWRSPQLSQTWRKPPYFPDVVPPICDTGRGSPTGVACYRHAHFPEPYRGGFFLADWTFGRIYHVPLKTVGSSHSGKHELFAEATGTSGFAPTALAVHPQTGELFVSIGGRGTRGGVYRITYDKADTDAKPLAMARRSLDFDRERAGRWLTDASESDDARTRRTALDMIVRWWDRAAWGPKLADAVTPNMRHADALVRRAAGRVALRLPVRLKDDSPPQTRLTLALAKANSQPEEALQTALEILRTANTTEEVQLEAVRVIQLVFGDLTATDAVGTVFEGYTLRNPPKQKTADHVLWALKWQIDSVAGRYRPDHRISNLDRELARTAAALGSPDENALTHVSMWLGELSRRNERAGSVRDDIHLLACWAQLSKWATRDEDGAIGATLLQLEDRRNKEMLGADRFWPVRIDELAAALIPCHKHLAATMARSPSFVRLENLRFLKYMNSEDTDATARLARRFLDAARSAPDSPFVPLIFEYLPLLPRTEIDPLLSVLWERPHLQDAVVQVLARSPRDGDHPRFLNGLGSLNPEIVRQSAGALAKLKRPDGAELLVAAVKALRRFPDEKGYASVREALVALLQMSSGETIGADAKAWTAWIVKRDPRAEKALNASAGFDAAAWGKRAASIDWSRGDAGRGRLAFTKATCAACHDGGGAIGPSLLGISKRFGRDDLLTAILQPSKDVSPRYRPTRVVTTEERAYTGIIVYEATDGVILQTGADTTVRIAGADITSKKQVEVSLMPTGLIDKLSNTEIADLLAYLATLGEPKTK
ncbi:DUF7133 domain-containing protein [Frigoriglobus tundricola]|uniref:Beta-propeller-type glycoside hydrolase n=1 Tax=Frigoriglobus tundricola TaxID=2774151 RepID=A0A6M5Z1T8_9BACT|nr:c-type cytochrome [Frigoriglobus tundricola]QJW99391.1 beta-propeller-type glycoside hydrolase [Frigoriglobus tundricola]